MVTDFTLLPGKLKDYSLKHGTSLLSQILINGMSFLDYTTLVLGRDEVALSELIPAEMIQPGGKDSFNPRGKFVFKSRIGKVRPVKVDLTFQPSDIVRINKSFMGEMAQALTRTGVYNIPFEAYFMAKIVEKAHEDLHLKAAFNGVYNAEGTSAADTMDGWLTLLKGMITSGEVPAGNVFAGAPITSANAIDQFRGVKRLVSDAYRNRPLICLAAPSKIEAYMEDYQTTFGSLPYNNQYKKATLDGSNIEFVPEVGMSGSNRIIITEKSNMFWLADNVANNETLMVEREKRNTHILMDFECAPEFGIGALIWTNDYAGI